MRSIHYRGIGLAIAASLGFMCIAWGQSPPAEDQPDQAHGRAHGRMDQQSGPQMGQHMVERMIWELELSPEQEATIRELIEREGPRLRDLHSTMRDSRRAVMDLDTTDPAYAQTLAEASETAGRTLTEIMQTHGQLRVEVQALLTAEQRELARDLRQRAHERMVAQMGRHFDRPPAAFIF